jgi:hypothetical protein
MLALVLLAFPLLAAAPPRSVKTATLQCMPGWRGQAVGVYGGVGFSVACNNGRGNERILGTAGTAWSFRMGIESDAVGADCAQSGDSATVDFTCAGAVQLTIR